MASRVLLGDEGTMRKQEKRKAVRTGHAGYVKVRPPNALPCGCRVAYEYERGAAGYTGEVASIPGGWRVCRHGHVWGLKASFVLHHTLDLGTNGLARNGQPYRANTRPS